MEGKGDKEGREGVEGAMNTTSDYKENAGYKDYTCSKKHDNHFISAMFSTSF